MSDSGRVFGEQPVSEDYYVREWIRTACADQLRAAVIRLEAEVERLRGENVELLAALSIGRFGALPYDNNAVIGKEIAERLNHHKPATPDPGYQEGW